MFPYGGYNGRILRVDLGRKTWVVEDLEPDLARSFLGGRSLGARLLYDEVAPGSDPLGPDNKLIFTTGPLDGTAAPSSGRFNISALSPLTGLYCFSLCSGLWGAGLKTAGYDVLIVEGVAEEPTTFLIHDARVVFRQARHLWGRDAV